MSIGDGIYGLSQVNNRHPHIIESPHDELSSCAVSHDGQHIPVIMVAGPGGTGKSLIATRLAFLLTRAESSPDVLLVDADLHQRSLTHHIETQCALTSGGLYDVIVSQNSNVDPMNLSDLKMEALRDDRPHSDSSEGRVFFLNSSARNIFSLYGKIQQSAQLQQLICKSLSYAAGKCGAKCIIVDTPPIADDPVFAICCSLADTIFFIGNQDRNITSIEEYQSKVLTRGVDLSNVYCYYVFNNMPSSITSVATQTGIFTLPHLEGVGVITDPNNHLVTNDIIFDNCINDIIQFSLRTRHPFLIPPWYAALPAVCRQLARGTRLASNSKHKYPLRLLLPQGWLPVLILGAGIGLSLLSHIINTKNDRGYYWASAWLLPLTLSIGIILLHMIVQRKRLQSIIQMLKEENIYGVLSTISLTLKEEENLPMIKKRKRLQEKHRSFMEKIAVLS